MPWSRPSLPDLLARCRGFMASRLQGADPALRRSSNRVLADLNAGASHEMHGHLAWVGRQILAITADPDWLDYHGREWIGPRTPASQAQGGVRITGTDGGVAPAGTVWRRADGATYTQDADATIAGGIATGALTAVDYGASTNVDAGAVLTIANPIPGINSSAAVAAGGLYGGSDAESDAAYLARILDRKQRPPEGGSAADYVRWAKLVPGVTRVWVTNEMGAGTVVVRFVRDGDPSIFPNEASLDDVRAAIAPRAPFPSDWYVYAPTPQAIPFSIWLSPSTAALRAAIQAELADLFVREGVPAGTIPWSHLVESIGFAVGSGDFRLLSPVDDIVLATGRMPVLGDFTWT
ncbi:Uncharacterized phage protein gp47/JayE [Methylomagnum ishizawai]|uniref:Uncharacterized phage protein gp47/JayE n=1 Tax=Methylomagnum ishizawai TaxID=1760988 RepID=A0A1Y6D0L1_9GAMM|nr:baseplate J/gp47 family protein [Methylomagnum ishizawai]SMF94363.1 Uncharacterized phage protein gp47/JayE [Methylomagnum ishizawai]